VGNEAAWWQDGKIDPITIARRLWQNSRIGKRRASPFNTRRLLAQQDFGTSFHKIEINLGSEGAY
jgi:hypothetical protein